MHFWRSLVDRFVRFVRRVWTFCSFAWFENIFLSFFQFYFKSIVIRLSSRKNSPQNLVQLDLSVLLIEFSSHLRNLPKKKWKWRTTAKFQKSTLFNSLRIINSRKTSQELFPLRCLPIWRLQGKRIAAKGGFNFVDTRNSSRLRRAAAFLLKDSR